MNGVIIVEGCDFTGKSTLIEPMAKKLNALILKECDIPSDYRKATQWVEEVNYLSQRRLVITDRCPAISEYIYSHCLRPNQVTLSNNQSLGLLSKIEKLITIVHCDPGWEQVSKCNNDQMEGVKERLEDLFRYYRSFLVGIVKQRFSVVRYNWTEGESAFRGLISYLRYVGHTPDIEMEYIGEFNQKFSLPEKWDDSKMREFRLKFLREEVDELEEALNPECPNYVKAFDALLDLVYVAKGTARMMGIDSSTWAQGMESVQRANMAKERVSSEVMSKRGSKLDVVKPKGWVGPEEELFYLLQMSKLL